MAHAAGIVLAGGRSTRMGAPKASLEWHGSTLLRHVTGLVARAVDGPMIVVRAPGQELPPLPDGIEVVDDAREDRGPLEGLAAGLGALSGRATVAFASSTDAPLLHPRFAARVLAESEEGVDVVLPVVGGFPHPLAAAYRVALAPAAERFVAEDQRLTRFVASCRVRELDKAALLADPALAAVDPELDSLLNLNRPGDYERARERPAPAIEVPGHGSVRAATLAEAQAATGVALTTLNGHAVAPDPQLPLAAGDVLRA